LSLCIYRNQFGSTIELLFILLFLKINWNYCWTKYHYWKLINYFINIVNYYLQILLSLIIIDVLLTSTITYTMFGNLIFCLQHITLYRNNSDLALILLTQRKNGHSIFWCWFKSKLVLLLKEFLQFHCSFDIVKLFFYVINKRKNWNKSTFINIICCFFRISYNVLLLWDGWKFVNAQFSA
jgi:hypothetical protein